MGRETTQIISHQFRTATNDGPGMEFFGLAYLLVFLAASLISPAARF